MTTTDRMRLSSRLHALADALEHLPALRVQTWDDGTASVTVDSQTDLEMWERALGVTCTSALRCLTSPDPFLAWKVAGVVAGQRVDVTWYDHVGAQILLRQRARTADRGTVVAGAA